MDGITTAQAVDLILAGRDLGTRDRAALARYANADRACDGGRADAVREAVIRWRTAPALGKERVTRRHEGDEEIVLPERPVMLGGRRIGHVVQWDDGRWQAEEPGTVFTGRRYGAPRASAEEAALDVAAALVLTELYLCRNPHDGRYTEED